LGIALAKLGKIDDARTQFEQTLRLDPNNRKAAEYLQALHPTQRKQSQRMSTTEGHRGSD